MKTSLCRLLSSIGQRPGFLTGALAAALILGPSVTAAVIPCGDRLETGWALALASTAPPRGG